MAEFLKNKSEKVSYEIELLKYFPNGKAEEFTKKLSNYFPKELLKKNKTNTEIILSGITEVVLKCFFYYFNTKKLGELLIQSPNKFPNEVSKIFSK